MRYSKCMYSSMAVTVARLTFSLHIICKRISGNPLHQIRSFLCGLASASSSPLFLLHSPPSSVTFIPAEREAATWGKVATCQTSLFIKLYRAALSSSTSTIGPTHHCATLQKILCIYIWQPCLSVVGRLKTICTDGIVCTHCAFLWRPMNGDFSLCMARFNLSKSSCSRCRLKHLFSSQRYNKRTRRPRYGGLRSPLVKLTSVTRR